VFAEVAGCAFAFGRGGFHISYFLNLFATLFSKTKTLIFVYSFNLLNFYLN